MRFYNPPWLRHGTAPGSGGAGGGTPGKAPAGSSAAAAAAAGASSRSKQLPAVFSIDLQPGGDGVRRLATAGQDGSLLIWNVDVLERSRSGGGGGGSTANGKGGGGAGAGSGGDDGGADTPPEGALLASLSSHSAAINCVRWSPDGSLLASAGDDGVVLLYECLRSVGGGGGGGGAGGSGGADGATASAFGAAAGLESWRCRRPLRGHGGDVTDLAWSPDGARLASASIDNTVHVWAVADGRRVAVLSGHAGLVKGVAWDPVGRFIASQGDDRSVIVWRTADWKVERRLAEPFADAVQHVHSLSFFLRLSWSPCGSQLLTPNAFRRPNHVAPLFGRASGFETQLDFVGHRAPVCATRFSPRLYVPTGTPPPALAAPPAGGGGADAPPARPAVNGGGVHAVGRGGGGESGWVDSASYTCLALGSKDKGATVWKASAATPFISLAKMFGSDLVDLSWGADGYTLAACSTDGHVMLLRFEAEELGVVVPRAQEARILSTIARSFGGTAVAAQLPESTTTLVMEDALWGRNRGKGNPGEGGGGAPDTPSRKRKAPDGAVGNGIADAGAAAPPTPAGAPPFPGTPVAAGTPTPPRPTVLLSKQREVRKGGKRRIIPTAVPAPGAAPPRALPSVLPGGGAPPPAGEAGGGATPASAAAPAAAAASPVAAVPVPRTPVPAASPAAAIGSPVHSRGFGAAAAAFPAAAGGTAAAAAAAPPPVVQRVVPRRRASAAAAAVMGGGAASAPTTPAAAPAAAAPAAGRGGATPPPAPTPSAAMDKLLAVDLPPPLSAAALAAVEKGNDGAPLAAASIRGLRTPLLPAAATATPVATAGAVTVRAIDARSPPTLVEVLPPAAAGAVAAASTLLVSRGGVVGWRDFLPAATPVVAVAGAAGRFVAVATVDGLLRLYSAQGGRRLAPPLALDSPPHVMEADVVGGVGGAGGVVRLGKDGGEGSSSDDDDWGGHGGGGAAGATAAGAVALPRVLAGRTTGRRGERWHLLLVTRSGLCTVYDVRTLRLVVTRCAASLLARVRTAGSAKADGDGGGPPTELYRSIVLGRVTPSGEPLLALSDGTTFLYDRRLAAWLRVAGGGDATYSEFTFAAATPSAAGSGGLVHRLQARAAATEAAAAASDAAAGGGGGGGAATAALTALAAEADARRASVETLGHLETLVWTAARLRSGGELRYYLACYAARLATVAGEAGGGGGGGGSAAGAAATGDRDPDAAAAGARLRELCDGLMEAAAAGGVGGPTGVALLKETVLPVVAANRGMQRLVAGYTDSLRELPAGVGGASGAT